MTQEWDHVVSVHRLTAFDQSKAEHSRQDYDIKKDPRIKETLSPYKQNSGNHHKITYKVGGSSWKPIHGHKINDFFPSRHKIKTSGQLNSAEAAHKIPTLFASQSKDSSELTRHQVLANRKVNPAYKKQLSPSRKAELHSQDKDSKWKEQSKSDSDEHNGNKHFRQKSNTVSDARNHAALANGEEKDEPLHITLYSCIGDTQALQQENSSNPIYNQKKNFAASKHRPSENKYTYNKENYDARKRMAERLPNRFSKMINNKNKATIKSASTQNMHNKINYPDKTKIHQEKDLSDDGAAEEHELEETLADNEEMENNLYDTLHDRQNPSAFEHIPQDSEDEEESSDNSHVYDKYGGDENYDAN
jgi:hypothetical protein